MSTFLATLYILGALALIAAAATYPLLRGES
jgi:hypothetical protein